MRLFGVSFVSIVQRASMGFEKEVAGPLRRLNCTQFQGCEGLKEALQ
ncbi:hypothetical protein ADU37_CDS19880 [Thermococcus sp. 2319x1]|nr:hypothetical protein ADU37_CDS19880 [Thermococcus sp. 2319x1]